MKSTNNESQLNNSNTQTTTKKEHYCTLRRPCYRIKKCNRCLIRRFKFIVQEVSKIGNTMNLTRFNTLNVVMDSNEYLDCLSALLEIRPKLYREIRRQMSKYVSLIAIEIQLNGQLTPHIHFISAELNETQLQRFRDTKISHKTTFESSPILDPYPKHLKKCLRYMLFKNMKKAISMTPKHTQLITASRGIKVGRPKFNTNFWWLV